MTEKTKVASECLCAPYFIHSLPVSVSLSDTHSLFLTHSLTLSLTHRHMHTPSSRGSRSVWVRGSKGSDISTCTCTAGRWTDLINQHPHTSRTVEHFDYRWAEHTGTHESTRAFVQSEVNMGLVMGTFSMQSKQVNYHKGKTFLFIFLNSKYSF